VSFAHASGSDSPFNLLGRQPVLFAVVNAVKELRRFEALVAAAGTT
jgi:hypothetical protein